MFFPPLLELTHHKTNQQNLGRSRCGCSRSAVSPSLARKLFQVEQRILAGHSDLRSFSPPDFAPIRRHP